MAYLDMAKGIGIILVVLGHSNYLPDNVLTVITSFHMPLFFILSGMLIRHTGEDRRPFRQIILRRLKSIMLPYAVFSVVYLLIYGGYFCCVSGSLTPEYIRELAIQAVSLNGMSVLWFLTALFFALLLFFAVHKSFSKRVSVVVLLGAALSACMSGPSIVGLIPAESLGLQLLSGFLYALLRGTAGAGFLTLGWAAMAGFEKADEEAAKTASNKFSKKFFIELSAGILCLGLTVPLSLYNGRVDLRYMQFHFFPVYILCACLGTLSVLFICRCLPPLKWLSYLGANSIIIMVTHVDCQYMLLSTRLGELLSSLSPRQSRFLFFAGAALCMTVLELITIYLTNRFVPFLFGRKSENVRGNN